MNRSESKYFNTAKLMDKALIELLETKEYEYISVKEICEKAGVNRSTFYLHYESIADLLEETMEYIHTSFMSSFDQTAADFIGQIQVAPLNDLVLITDHYLEPYLRYIYENQSVYKANLKNPKSMSTDKKFTNIKKYILDPIMARFDVPSDVRNYWSCYYISGVTAIIEEWLGRNCKESIEEIENIIIQCVRPKNALVNKKFGE